MSENFFSPFTKLALNDNLIGKGGKETLKKKVKAFLGSQNEWERTFSDKCLRLCQWKSTWLKKKKGMLNTGIKWNPPDPC